MQPPGIDQWFSDTQYEKYFKLYGLNNAQPHTVGANLTDVSCLLSQLGPTVEDLTTNCSATKLKCRWHNIGYYSYTVIRWCNVLWLTKAKGNSYETTVQLLFVLSDLCQIRLQDSVLCLQNTSWNYPDKSKDSFRRYFTVNLHYLYHLSYNLRLRHWFYHVAFL